MGHPAIADILRLPLPERLEIAEAIWDSIADAAEAGGLLQPGPDQRRELQRRSEEHDRDPSTAISLEELRRKLKSR